MHATARKTQVAALSVLSNSLLVAGKLAIGLTIGSVSVISEALHSAVDLVASVIAWASVRVSGKPADAKHPFGHGKIENLSGTIEAVLIAVAAVWIIIEAVGRLRHPEPVEHAGLGVAIMAVSAVVNWAISQRLFRIGRETDSVALIADAWHLRTDVYASLGVMAGLAILTVGGWCWPTLDLGWVDPVAAILVALLILQAAWELTISAGRDLLDVGLPPEEVEVILGLIRKADGDILSVGALCSRKSGAERHVEVTVGVPPHLTIDLAHSIADRIEAAIDARYPGTRTTVHVEPYAERLTDDGARCC